MGTPHNEAEKGEIAKRVLMPGDPLRAKYIAEHFLEDAVCFNTVRNMLGYTGTYKGEKISVMGGGMGVPSVGIYTYELYHEYEVEEIIRIGSAGALQDDVDLRDVVIAVGACTDSNYAAQYNLPGTFAPIADYELLESAVNTVREKGLTVRAGNVLTSDVFYNDDPTVNDRWRKMGVLAVEMESAALYMNAARAGKKEGQVIYTATAKYTDESGKEFTATAVKETNLSIYYEVHRQDYGWEVDAKDEADLSKWKKDGMDSGTVGECKRLEAIKIKLPDGVSGSVQYRTHIQDIGWESKWAEDGALSGTSGKAKRLEAIQIKLSGKVADNYDIYYCVHAQNVGWLGWAKNGEQAGTAGYAYRLEAIRIKLVPKGEKPPKNVGSTDKAMEARLVGYQTHVQDIGTQDYVYDGAMAGTSGQAKRMESIRIKLPSTMASEGKIEYKSHIENIGWEKSWKKTGELSGTTGKSLRLEAIQIKLSGDIAEKYDVYYRVHAENFGWLGWAKNGEKSGTEGYAYRLEALQIKLVPKGTENPELPTPASAKKEAFIKK